MDKRELQAAVRDAAITMPYNWDADKKKEALIALFEDLSVTDKLVCTSPSLPLPSPFSILPSPLLSPLRCPFSLSFSSHHKQKSKVPKGLKPATVDHLRRAIEGTFSGELVKCAFQAIDSRIAKSMSFSFSFRSDSSNLYHRLVERTLSWTVFLHQAGIYPFLPLSSLLVSFSSPFLSRFFLILYCS